MSGTGLYVLYVLLAAGAAGVGLCLPSPGLREPRRRLAGGLLGLAALAGAGGYWTRWLSPAFQGRAFFVIFAFIAVVGAVRCVTHRRPLYSVLYFVLVVLAASALCVLGAAEFLAAGLVIVYAGAIVVVYVFVIMLVQQKSEAWYDRTAREPWAAAAVGFLLVAAATQAMVSNDALGLRGGDTTGPRALLEGAGGAGEAGRSIPGRAAGQRGAAAELDPAGVNPPMGNTRAVGAMLMTDFVIALQVAGLLLLVAMMGAIVIARKQVEPEALTPQERAALDAQRADLRRRGREAAPF